MKRKHERKSEKTVKGDNLSEGYANEYLQLKKRKGRSVIQQDTLYKSVLTFI